MHPDYQLLQSQMLDPNRLLGRSSPVGNEVHLSRSMPLGRPQQASKGAQTRTSSSEAAAECRCWTATAFPVRAALSALMGAPRSAPSAPGMIS